MIQPFLAATGLEGDLALHHLLSDRQNVARLVVEEHPAVRHLSVGRREVDHGGLGLLVPAEIGQCHCFGVVDQRIGGDIQFLVHGLIKLEDVSPHAEADVDVRRRGDEGLEDVRIRANHLVGHFPAQANHSIDRRSLLAEEHRAVEREMQVVNAVERVEVRRARVGLEPVVDVGRGQVSIKDVLVVSAEYVDVRGHVHEMAGIRHEVLEPVAVTEGAFGVRRHLHQVDVHVQQARMIPGARGLFKGALKDSHSLGGRGIRVRYALVKIPELPRRPVHHGLGIETGDVEVVGVCLVDRLHRGSEAVVEGLIVFDRGVGGIARCQYLNESTLCRRRGLERKTRPEGLMRAFECRALLLGGEHLPRLVIVWADGVGDAPMGKRTGRIGCHCLFETDNRFLVIVCEQPDKAAVEPRLRIRVFAGRAAVATQIEIVLHEVHSPFDGKR